MYINPARYISWDNFRYTIVIESQVHGGSFQCKNLGNSVQMLSLTHNSISQKDSFPKLLLLLMICYETNLNSGSQIVTQTQRATSSRAMFNIRSVFYYFTINVYLSSIISRSSGNLLYL